MHPGRRNRKKNVPFSKKAHIMPPLLLSAALLLTGCAPEEKTLLLTIESSSDEETEQADASRDFSVKKIYTYAYETRSELEKSAFLQGCGENEIHILALESTDGEERLAYREVDYRYGFYDTVGAFRQTWKEWNNPDSEETEGHLYIEDLLPAPDGRQLLVYLRSAFWDRAMVWLYTLGEPELLLYEGTVPADGPLQGSFSPDGRWVTFDAAGLSTGTVRLVPVYDCRRNLGTEAPGFWTIPSTDTRLSPPDQMLYTDLHSPVWPWEVKLCDAADGQAGLTSLAQNRGDSFVSATRITPIPNLAAPDASLLSDETNQASKHYHQYQSCYLYEQEDMPYLRYNISGDGNAIDYLETPHRLCSMDMDTLSPRYQPMEFPGIIWDFHRLDSGDLLVALAQEPDRNAADSGTGQFLSRWVQQSTRLCASLHNPFGALAQPPLFLAGGSAASGENASIDYVHVAIQDFWGLQSADLYLYPHGETEGHLLYKNLQNLIGMEYDAQNGRILLETYEGTDLTHRKCIILEL